MLLGNARVTTIGVGIGDNILCLGCESEKTFAHHTWIEIRLPRFPKKVKANHILEFYNVPNDCERMQ